MNDLREEVRARYADAAARAKDVDTNLDVVGADCGCGSATTESCCGAPRGSSCCGPSGGFGEVLYASTEKQVLPDAAVLASLGCGNPTAVADLRPGETVLDLGSGGGIDVLLSARRVGRDGMVFGLDMTDEMLELAEENRRRAGADNVRFLKGFIEDVPLPASSVDIVISNCVINLSVDKPRVFAEMFRVLKPGGRVGISDVVAADELDRADRAERGSYVGCIAGALSFTEYQAGLRAAGFDSASITPTHEIAPQMYSAIVKATKPG